MSASDETLIQAASGLAKLVAGRANPDAASWLLAQLSASDFPIAFSSAGRRLGTSPLVLGDDAASLDAATRLAIGERGLDEVGRIALLLNELSRAPGAGNALVLELFERGTNREKQAVLRALPLLAVHAGQAQLDRERLVSIGVEACRSSVQTIFDAIACENSLPADHFSDAEFNQLVLKALFIQTSVARIFGLERRASAELLRMAEGYASERRAAGRAVPTDIEIIAAHARSIR